MTTATTSAAGTGTAAPGTAGTGRRYRVTDVLRIPVPSGATLSPDGQRIVYVLRTPDAGADRNVSALWEVPADGSAPARPLTDGPDDGAPAWSPDGTRLAFLRPVDGVPQLWLRDDEGTERALTRLELGVGAPEWSPDGRSLACTAPVARPGRPEPGAPIVIDTDYYRRDGAGLQVGVRAQVHVVELSTQRVRQVTDLDWDAHGPVWSPDGRRIAFGGDERCAGGYPLHTAAYVVAADADGESHPRRVSPARGQVSSLSWLPDGQLWAAGRLVAGGPDRLLHLPVDGEPRELVVREAGSGMDLGVAVGGGEWAGARITAWPDGRLAVGVNRASRFHLVAVDRATGTATDVLAPDLGMVVGSSGPAGARVAAIVADDRSYGEIVVLPVGQGASVDDGASVDGGETRTLTSHTLTALPDVGFVAPQRRESTAADGTRIGAWVLRAPQTAGAGPMLVDVHGGPHLCWPPALQQANPYHQALLALGWTVLLPDPRGSDGYGEAFYSANLGRWGLEDATDVLGLVDDLVADGLADPQRLAVAGYSYGGYLTLRLLTRTDRFRAAVSGGGICDLTSLYGSDDVAPQVSELELGAPLFTSTDAQRRGSAIEQVGRVGTPTLLLHAEHDHRCPIGQSELWYTALRRGGVPVSFVRYPDASHQFLVDGKPSHRLDYNRRIVDWLQQHVTPSETQ